MAITNSLAVHGWRIHGHLAAALPWQPEPGSLRKPLARRMVRAAVTAPRRTADDNVATLAAIAPPLINDVLYTVADVLGPRGMAAAEEVNYERSSGALRERRLQAYGECIGLKDKPAAMGWTRYITRLYAAAALKGARDRVLLDLAWGDIKPDDAVTLFPDDEDVVTTAVKQHGYALKLASARLRANMNVAITAVRQNGYATAFVDKNLCARRDFAVIAVRSNGFALRELSEALRDDPVIVGLAVDSQGEAIGSASERWRADLAMAKRALRQSGWAVRHLAPALRDNDEVARLAVGKVGEALAFLNARFWHNDELVHLAVNRSGRAMRWAAPRFTRDKALGLRAVANNPYAYTYLDQSLQRDPDIAAETLRRGQYMRRFVEANRGRA